MKAMVTGGAGFIGSTLVDRLLAEGWRVDVVDDLSTGSLANLADARVAARSPVLVPPHRRRRRRRWSTSSRTAAPTSIFHLAAQADVRVSVARPVFDATVNILGSLNVCEGARRGRRRARSCSRLRAARSTARPTRSRCARASRRSPESPYGVAKKAVGDYLYYYRTIRGLEYTALALANVYGPRQNPHGEAGVVSIFAGKLLGHERPVIFGDGSQTRDFVYVDDVVDAFVRAVDKGGGLLMNIGTGVETSVQQLFDVMAKLTGFKQHARVRPASRR